MRPIYRTNYKGKLDAALGELKNGQDFVYVHIKRRMNADIRRSLNKVRAD